MVKFLIVTCTFAACLVMVANSAYYDLHAHISSAPMATGPSIGRGPSAGGPSADCNSLIYKMTDCLEFLIVDGTDSKPEASCCSGFKEVLKTDAHCICEGFKSAAGMGFIIDMKKAATLPAACKVSAPSIRSCNASTAPRSSPANPPELAPPSNSPIPSVPTLPPTAKPPRPAVIPPRLAPGANSPKPSVPTFPPTANPPNPAVPSGAPSTTVNQGPSGEPSTSVDQGPSGAPSTSVDQGPAVAPATSGTYTTCSSYLVPLTLIAGFVVFQMSA